MRRSLVFAGFLALTPAVLVGASDHASADVATTAAPGPFTFPAGSIRLEKTATGPQVALYAGTSATPTTVIPITLDKKCVITNLAQISTLLQISAVGSTHPLAMVDNGIGIASSAAGNCNPDSGRISTGQSLVIRPGTSITQTFVGASLNIEGKHAASLGWTSYAGDQQVATGTNPLVGRADVGPDSGAGDNTTVPVVSPAFDWLALTEASGNTNAAIALDNGGDTGDGTPTVFQLGETEQYAVNCTDQNTVTTSGSSSIQNLTFERLANGYNPDKDPTCYKIGVSLTIMPGALTENGEPRDVAQVDNTTTAIDGTRQEVRALVTITWRVARYSSDGSLRTEADLDTELNRQIIYGADSSVRVDSQWCGRYTVPHDGYAAEPEHPAGQPWCLISDTRQIQGDYIVQTQVYHGEGDPRFI